MFGHIGDRIGRKSLLQFSLVLIGISSFMMGCLPSIASVGYWAPSLGAAIYMRESKGVSLLAIDEEDMRRLAEEKAR